MLSKLKLVIGVAVLCAGTSFAAGVTFNETGSGFMGDIFQGVLNGGATQIIAASDGEGPFDPFGFGADTSDGIQFTGFGGIGQTWTSFGSDAWLQVAPINGADTQTWVLPAVIPGCGSENEPTCEPVGAWYIPGGFFSGPDGFFPYIVTILEEDSTNVSDIVTAGNFGPGGTAAISFASDPNPTIPEPGTLLMMGLGLLGVGYRAYSRKRAA